MAKLASAPVRNIVITGANTGVGFAGAKILTAAGHHVTLACRTQAKADAAAKACLAYAASSADNGPATGAPGFYGERRAGGTAVGAECDLTSLASIKAFAAAQKEPIDSLVLNAGLSLNVGDDKEQFTKDGFELTVGTNYLGQFALYKLLEPALAKGAAARLVVTGSGVHDPASEGGKQGGPEKWAGLGALDGLAGGPGFTMVDGGAYDPDKAYKDSKPTCSSCSRRRGPAGKLTANSFSPGLIADPKVLPQPEPAVRQGLQTITQKAGVSERTTLRATRSRMAVDPALAGKTGGWYDALPLGSTRSPSTRRASRRRTPRRRRSCGR